MRVNQPGIAGSGDMYYVYSDNLGSILTVTDGISNTYNQSFDAWGNYRNPTNGSYTSLPTNPSWLYRGYTGHEHLPEFQLINANGRLYDPLVNSFLSPDPYVQSPTNTQNYNRYSYCLNNPLKYTDPSGLFYSITAQIAANEAAAASKQGWLNQREARWMLQSQDITPNIGCVNDVPPFGPEIDGGGGDEGFCGGTTNSGNTPTDADDEDGTNYEVIHNDNPSNYIESDPVETSTVTPVATSTVTCINPDQYTGGNITTDCYETQNGAGLALPAGAALASLATLTEVVDDGATTLYSLGAALNYGVVKNAGTAIGSATGPAATLAGAGYDIYQYTNNQITGGEFAYDELALGASITATAATGGNLAVGAGVYYGLMGGQYLYNNPQIMQNINNLPNNYWNNFMNGVSNFQFQINSGNWCPH